MYETLSWRFHLVELSSKLARSVGIFDKLRHFVSLEILKSVYCAVFYPFLSYGITVLGATLGQYLKPVLVSQKKVVRAMTFSDPSDLQILKLDDTYHVHVSSFVYECYNNLAPNHFSDYFTQVSDIHHHNISGASHGDFLLKRKNTLQCGLCCVCFNGANI